MTQRSDDGKKTSDTDFVTKAERGSGVLIYRGFISICMLVIAGLGAWNLSETHSTAVLVRGLSEHVKDSDREMNRIASEVLELSRTVEEIKDHGARLDTRVSIIESRGKP